MSEDFNAHSTDSMFSTIIARLDHQDRITEEFRNETREFRRSLNDKLTGCEGRVSSLEADRNKAYGIAAGAGGFMGWISGVFKS